MWNDPEDPRDFGPDGPPPESKPVPAPEPRCACGRPAEDWKHTRPEWTDYHAFTPAPEPSMRMSDEEFNANSAAWNYRFLAEARRTRASEENYRLSALAEIRAHAALRAEVERLNGEMDSLAAGSRLMHKERDAALAERDALTERVKAYELDRCESGHHSHGDCTEACSCVGLGKSRIEKLEAERDALRRVAEDFVKKHDEIQPHLDGVFSFYAGHGMKWPETLNWKVELDAMRAAALAGRP